MELNLHTYSFSAKDGCKSGDLTTRRHYYQILAKFLAFNSGYGNFGLGDVQSSKFTYEACKLQVLEYKTQASFDDYMWKCESHPESAIDIAVAQHQKCIRQFWSSNMANPTMRANIKFYDRQGFEPVTDLVLFESFDDDAINSLNIYEENYTSGVRTIVTHPKEVLKTWTRSIIVCPKPDLPSDASTTEKGKTALCRALAAYHCLAQVKLANKQIGDCCYMECKGSWDNVKSKQGWLEQHMILVWSDHDIEKDKVSGNQLKCFFSNEAGCFWNRHHSADVPANVRVFYSMNYTLNEWFDKFDTAVSSDSRAAIMRNLLVVEVGCTQLLKSSWQRTDEPLPSNLSSLYEQANEVKRRRID